MIIDTFKNVDITTLPSDVNVLVSSSWTCYVCKSPSPWWRSINDTGSTIQAWPFKVISRNGGIMLLHLWLRKKSSLWLGNTLRRIGEWNDRKQRYREMVSRYIHIYIVSWSCMVFIVYFTCGFRKQVWNRFMWIYINFMWSLLYYFWFVQVYYEPYCTIFNIDNL